ASCGVQPVVLGYFIHKILLRKRHGDNVSAGICRVVSAAPEQSEQVIRSGTASLDQAYHCDQRNRNTHVHNVHSHSIMCRTPALSVAILRQRGAIANGGLTSKTNEMCRNNSKPRKRVRSGAIAGGRAVLA